MRWLVRGVLVLASLSVAAVFAQEKPLWRMELWPGAQPVEAGRESLRSGICASTCLRWEDDGAPVFCRAGDPWPTLPAEGRPLAVRVLHPDGLPAPGVRVAWKVEGWPPIPAPWGEKPSDSEGLVAFRVPPTGKVTLWVNEEVWSPSAVTAPADSAEAVILLDPAPPDSLRILDPLGRPVAGARLVTIARALLADPLAATRMPGFGLQESRADAFGRLRLPPSGGDSAGWVLAVGYRLHEWEGPSKRTILLEPVPPVRLLPRPEKGVTVPERLTVRTVGRVPGIPWASLSLSTETAPSDARAFPFAEGVEVEVTGEGLEAVFLGGLEGQEGNAVDVPLRQGMRLGGIVLTERGEPVGGARVGVEELPRRSAYWTATDDRGRFQLTSLPRGSWSLRLSARGLRESTFGPYGPKDRLDLRLALRRGGVVRGSLGENEAETCRVVLKATSREGGATRQQDVAISKDGTFEAGGLEPGEYGLLAWSPRRGRASIVFTLAEEEEKDLGEVLFETSPRVTGTVEGPDGEPWEAGAEVELKRILKAADATTAYPPRVFTEKAQTDGSFSFVAVPEGRYEIRAVAGGASSAIRKIEVAKEDVEAGTLVLEPSGSLAGRLVSRGGRSLEGWVLRLKTQAYDPTAPHAVADSEGAFDFGAVSPGSYRLELCDGKGPTPRATRAVDVQAGQEHFLRWPVEGVTFSALLKAGGQAASGAVLVVEPASDGFEEGGLLQVSGGGGATIFGLPSRILRAKADEAGFAGLSDASPGPAHATLFWEGAQYVAPVTVPESDGALVTWDFSGVSLEGRVVEASGEAAPGAVVAYAYEGFGESPARSVAAGPGGAFVLPSMGAGRLVLTARGEGGRKGMLPVEVADRPVTGLVLRLE